VLSSAILEARLVQLILQQTTTLGVRVHALAHRHEAERTVREISTQYGTVRMKIKLLEGRSAGAVPEFEDCRRLADQHGVPVRVVLEAAWAAGHQESDSYGTPT
jgi:uncharacterized protein (DUF111 family)